MYSVLTNGMNGAIGCMVENNINYSNENMDDIIYLEAILD